MVFVRMVVALLFFGMTASPALAHAGLVSSDPVDGSVLTTAPVNVTLQFNEDLLEDTVSVAIRDGDDQVVSTETAIADGPTVVVPWPTDLADGAYRLAYRVVSADGHPVTGEIGIVLNTAQDPSVTAQPAASSSGLPTWLIGLLAVAVVATVGLFLLARRKRP